ncbi:hypothetical protein J6590_088372 [Homalodisca vitripennis]|nr:hypothetical protein J6590_089392 [Homalodisca vitripennis]KAG8329351.1 hypothetical protein J6590_088372 [Homalodisca vitripennis]
MFSYTNDDGTLTYEHGKITIIFSRFSVPCGKYLSFHWSQMTYEWVLTAKRSLPPEPVPDDVTPI